MADGRRRRIRCSPASLRPRPSPRPTRFDEATATTSPRARAEGVADARRRSARTGFTAAGAFETIASEVAVANSNGQFCWSPSSQASVTTVVTRRRRWQRVRRGVRDRRRRRGPGGDRAARRGQGRRLAGPRATSSRGDTPWCWSPRRSRRSSASSHGSGSAAGRCTRDARASPASRGSRWQRRRSRSTTTPRPRGRSASRSTSKACRRSRVDLIRDGVFQGGVYDLRTAEAAGTKTTGHALPPPNPEGPFPLNLFMEPGGASLDEMIAATERGLLDHPVPLHERRASGRVDDHRHDP